MLCRDRQMNTPEATAAEAVAATTDGAGRFAKYPSASTVEVSGSVPRVLPLTAQALSVVRGHAVIDRLPTESSTETVDGFVAVKALPSVQISHADSGDAAGTSDFRNHLLEPGLKNQTTPVNKLEVPKWQPNDAVNPIESTLEHVALDLEEQDADPIYTAMLNDQRNSLQMRSQAYASIAVVAALIAGISVTFVVEIDVNPEDDGTGIDGYRPVILQFCAVGTLLVCFMSLYGTMVLSMQYYLVTRALGHVSTVSQRSEAAVLNEVSQFMHNTRWIRHLAVKSVVVSVPLFGIVLGAFGVAKNGIGSVAYGSIAICVVACAFFAHAVYAQNAAFGHPQDFDTTCDGELPSATPKKSSVLFKTEKESFTPNTKASLPRHLLKQTKAQASNFRLVW